MRTAVLEHRQTNMKVCCTFGAIRRVQLTKLVGARIEDQGYALIGSADVCAPKWIRTECVVWIWK